MTNAAMNGTPAIQVDDRVKVYEMGGVAKRARRVIGMRDGKIEFDERRAGDEASGR